MVNNCRNSNFLLSRNKIHEKSSATKNLVRHANGRALRAKNLVRHEPCVP
jgi:hypothetical protein